MPPFASGMHARSPLVVTDGAMAVSYSGLMSEREISPRHAALCAHRPEKRAQLNAPQLNAQRDKTKGGNGHFPLLNCHDMALSKSRVRALRGAECAVECGAECAVECAAAECGAECASQREPGAYNDSSRPSRFCYPCFSAVPYPDAQAPCTARGGPTGKTKPCAFVARTARFPAPFLSPSRGGMIDCSP